MFHLFAKRCHRTADIRVRAKPVQTKPFSMVGNGRKIERHSKLHSFTDARVDRLSLGEPIRSLWRVSIAENECIKGQVRMNVEVAKINIIEWIGRRRFVCARLWNGKCCFVFRGSCGSQPFEPCISQ